MYFDGSSKASIYCTLRDLGKFDNNFGLTKQLEKHWAPRQRYKQAASTEIVCLRWL